MKSIVAAIIVAAGASSRMGDACADKLMLKIHDCEVLARTMLCYQQAESIHEIYVVTRQDRMERVKALAEKYNITKFVGCCVGGASRQHSVQNGLALCPHAALVAIADGARPFTKPDDIDRVTRAAAEHGGALLCVPVKDTIKVISPNGTVDHTPPRNALLQAQTPQTFQRALFCQLMERSMAERREVTDDASIFEMYGHKVMAVMGDYDNIKITTKEDILVAQAIAGKERS